MNGEDIKMGSTEGSYNLFLQAWMFEHSHDILGEGNWKHSLLTIGLNNSTFSCVLPDTVPREQTQHGSDLGTIPDIYVQ